VLYSFRTELNRFSGFLSLGKRGIRNKKGTSKRFDLFVIVNNESIINDNLIR